MFKWLVPYAGNFTFFPKIPQSYFSGCLLFQCQRSFDGFLVSFDKNSSQTTYCGLLEITVKPYLKFLSLYYKCFLIIFGISREKWLNDLSNNLSTFLTM